MICVYSSDTSTFINNGLAVLEPTLCELTMTINGAWILTLEHPYDLEGKYLNLEKGNIIKVTDIGILRGCDTTQRYRIYDTVKGLSSMRVIALPVGMEATYDAIIEELNIKAKTGNQAVALISSYLTNHGVSKYTLTASGLSKKRTTKFKNTNLIAALCGSDDGSIVNKYGAEIAYNNYQIFVKSHIGNTTPQYDVRIGKNLTGLSYDTDDSAVVTRLYPISDDDIRYNSFDTGTSGNNSYYDAENIDEYPFIRAAFVDVPYSLIDTDISDENPYKTDTTDLTEEIYNTVYNNGEAAIQAFWADVCAENVFEYTHESETSVIYLIPEFVQDVIKVISTTVADNVLNDAGVIHEGLRSWLTKAIRASMEWVEDVDLPMKGWIQNQDNSYSYGTELRKLTNEWGYIDRKMSWFGSDTKWVEKKDDKFDWDWIQKKGQRAKYGNDKRYLARATYIYNWNDYEGGANDDFYKYWFDADGYYDGEEETTTWDWRGSGTESDPYWFGESDPAGDTSKYAHDCWLFIRTSSDSARKLYHFNSDGYLDDEEVVGWDWLKDGEKWYFGSTNKNSRTTNLVSQWMKIDGDYYYFDSNGYVVDLKDTMMGLAEVLSFYLSDVLIDAIQGGQNELYNCLYAHMKDYCDDLYDNGLCDPTINVSIDFVDLSMTEEYKDFSDLEKVCLGDRVKVIYNLYGNTQYSIEEYVKGLTYDCIRGYNTKIEVGGVSSVTSLFDTSVKGTGNEQRLVAGENVTINGNVINVSANTGDVYAGDKVSVTQLQTTGQPIAKIYVNGMPTTIYAVGSDVEVEPIKTEGDKIATITVGGVDYDIYADTGLKYWVETETDIYRTGQRDEISGSDTYLKKSTLYLTTYGAAVKCEARKKNNKPALCAYVQNQSAQGAVYGTYYVSTKNVDAEWEWRSWEQPYGQEGHWGAWKEPGQQGQIYTLFDTTASFTYKGATWYVHVSSKLDTYETINIPSIPYISSENSIVDTAKRIIDLANASPYTEDIVGISNQDHILYYNDDKKNNYDTENRDDAVYISKDGIFNGSEFRVNGTAIGSFYKTNLYLGTGYSATVGLSDSYTDYDLLLIETYNQDDKNNLASMVNVSDLSTGSYIGVNEYLMYTITNGRTLTFHEAPNDSNHSRYVKAVYGLRTSHESGTQSPIEDVQVDGASVVSGGVAVIDLSSKQDALTAGNNVQISNQGVISATDTTYSDFAGSSHGLVPSASSGDSSKYLKGDGTWGTPDTGTTYTAGANIQISEQNVISATDTTYSDFDGTNSGLVPEPQSGDSGYLKHDGTWDEPEGTTVIANPSGTAIDTLTKIQVENTIYDIASGSYIEVATSILQSYTEWTEKYTSGMVAYYSSDKIYFATASYTDSDRAMAVYKVQIPASVKKIRYSITQKRTDAQDPTQDMYKLCVGVKNSYDDVNYSTPTDSDFLVKNLHEFEAYNVVTNGELDISSISSAVYLYIIANGFACEVTKVEVVEYKAGLEDLADVNISNPSNGQVLTYNSNNQEWVNTNASGGTTVIANPSGSATATLTKLQVESTIYEVSGGGGGGSRTLLYSGSAVTGTITLSESYENFDYLYVVAYAVGEITALVDTEKLGYEIGAFTLSECSGVSPSSVSDMYVALVVTSSTVLTITDAYGGIVIKKIYGITGLGGGASAIDDLTDVDISSATNGQVLTFNSTTSKWENQTPSGGGGASDLDDLTDVDITTPSDGQVLQYDSANSKWINATPSSGGGYTKTLLYDAGSNTSYAPYNQNVQLLDDIDNYDELLMLCCSAGDGGLSAYTVFFYADAKLAQTYKPIYTGWFKRTFTVDFSNRTYFRYSGSCEGESNRQPYIYKIYGIKY